MREKITLLINFSHLHVSCMKRHFYSQEPDCNAAKLRRRIKGDTQVA